MDGNEPQSQINGTTLAEGPWGRSNWSQQLYKSPNSYMKFQVMEREDKNDFTILAWLYIATAASRPSQASKPWSFGLNMNLSFEGGISDKKAFIKLLFAPRPPQSKKVLAYDGLEKNLWYYVGITFNQKKELSTLWVNDQPVGSAKTSIFDLIFSKRILWIGSKIENVDSPHLKIRLSCVQFFTATLTREAMARTRSVCRGKKEKKATKSKLWLILYTTTSPY